MLPRIVHCVHANGLFAVALRQVLADRQQLLAVVLALQRIVPDEDTMLFGAACCVKVSRSSAPGLHDSSTVFSVHRELPTHNMGEGPCDQILLEASAASAGEAAAKHTWRKT